MNIIINYFSIGLCFSQNNYKRKYIYELWDHGVVCRPFDTTNLLGFNYFRNIERNSVSYDIGITMYVLFMDLTIYPLSLY